MDTSMYASCSRRLLVPDMQDLLFTQTARSGSIFSPACRTSTCGSGPDLPKAAALVVSYRAQDFKQLAGWGAEAPRAKIHRLKMWNAARCTFQGSSSHVIPGTAGAQRASWTPRKLGGRDHVRELGNFFSNLKASGTRLSIIAKGDVGARYLLEHEGLLQFFEHVFSMGQFQGESDFGRANPEPSELEGNPDCELRGSIANLLRSLVLKEPLAVDETCLAEDGPQEITYLHGICCSAFVAERREMMEREMGELKRRGGAKGIVEAAKKGPAVNAMAPATAVATLLPPPDGFSGVYKATAKNVPPPKDTALPLFLPLQSLLQLRSQPRAYRACRAARSCTLTSTRRSPRSTSSSSWRCGVSRRRAGSPIATRSRC
ncbi:unnamed protein product [Symbiodinium sp. CCMP2592]|nr:unnamed protein product [Symbiodinium sp. CCMP2592]